MFEAELPHSREAHWPVTLSLPAHLHVGQAWTQRYSVNGITTVSRQSLTARGVNTGASSPPARDERVRLAI